MTEMSILLASQCRAARAMLGLSQKELAQKAEVGSRTLADFETGTRSPHPRTLKAIRETLCSLGIVFLDAEGGLGPGLRLDCEKSFTTIFPPGMELATLFTPEE
ncbi:putative transcriptional regulator [Acetobacter lovaniensis NRIC 0474]|nr:putative transcriptional regulator [Acetobacter lovaniensis NRIC 0474]